MVVIWTIWVVIGLGRGGWERDGHLLLGIQEGREISGWMIYMVVLVV